MCRQERGRWAKMCVACIFIYIVCLFVVTNLCVICLFYNVMLFFILLLFLFVCVFFCFLLTTKNIGRFTINDIITVEFIVKSEAPYTCTRILATGA